MIMVMGKCTANSSHMIVITKNVAQTFSRNSSELRSMAAVTTSAVAMSGTTNRIHVPKWRCPSRNLISSNTSLAMSRAEL